MKQPNVMIPTFDAMIPPTLQALKDLGGSGTTDEIYEQVIQILKLPDSVLEISHGDRSQTEVEYRLAWSRTYLKKHGLIENSSRGVWSLVSTEIDIRNLDVKEIVKAVRGSCKSKAIPDNLKIDELQPIDLEPLAEQAWTEQLHSMLLSLAPDAFERLVQRLLRESGFSPVHVLGKSGDGGIDGVGIARINGFLSFHVLFQCKRYQGSVSAAQIRDFRGAMQGRTDKGLMITTGTFTREAIKEATRDGAPPIDLIDGDQLVQRLKELGLGVNITMIESIEVDPAWFAKI